MNKIWHPNDINSANWFIEGSELGIDWVPHIIPKPGNAEFLNLPEPFKNILKLDTPDLIVTIDQNGVDIPVISIEITSTTPQSQHAKQRIPRLIAAAESNVPALYIIPKRKLSGGTQYPLGMDLYNCVNKIRTVTGIPVFIYNFPDENGVLINDLTYPNQPYLQSEEMLSAFNIIDVIIQNQVEKNQIESLYENALIIAEIERHDVLGNEADVNVGKFETLTEINTDELYTYINSETDIHPSRIRATLDRLPDRIINREQTLIFHPKGRMFDHAGDPYTGMIGFFDYVFCRTGPNIEDRNKNLVYMPKKEEIRGITDKFTPDGYHNYWDNKCPFRNTCVPSLDDQFLISHHLQYGCVFTKIKPLRVYGYFADMIIFKDSILVF